MLQLLAALVIRMGSPHLPFPALIAKIASHMSQWTLECHIRIPMKMEFLVFYRLAKLWKVCSRQLLYLLADEWAALESDPKYERLARIAYIQPQQLQAEHHISVFVDDQLRFEVTSLR